MILYSVKIFCVRVCFNLYMYGNFYIKLIYIIRLKVDDGVLIEFLLKIINFL